MDDRAVYGRGLLADADHELPRVLGAAQLDPPVSQAEQVREGLGDGPFPAQDPAHQLGARGAGEQQVLAQARLGDLLQMEAVQAQLMGEPCHQALRAVRSAASSRRARAARTASWRRSHQ